MQLQITLAMNLVPSHHRHPPECITVPPCWELAPRSVRRHFVNLWSLTTIHFSRRPCKVTYRTHWLDSDYSAI